MEYTVREQRSRELEENLHFCERSSVLMKAIEESRLGMRILEGNVLEVWKQEQLEGEALLVVPVQKNWLEGVIRGMDGMAEWLCRCSTLYPCLVVEGYPSSYPEGEFIYIPKVMFANRYEKLGEKKTFSVLLWYLDK